MSSRPFSTQHQQPQHLRQLPLLLLSLAPQPTRWALDSTAHGAGQREVSQQVICLLRAKLDFFPHSQSSLPSGFFSCLPIQGLEDRDYLAGS